MLPFTNRQTDRAIRPIAPLALQAALIQLRVLIALKVAPTSCYRARVSYARLVVQLASLLAIVEFVFLITIVQLLIFKAAVDVGALLLALLVRPQRTSKNSSFARVSIFLIAASRLATCIAIILAVVIIVFFSKQLQKTLRTLRIRVCSASSAPNSAAASTSSQRAQQMFSFAYYAFNRLYAFFNALLDREPASRDRYRFVLFRRSSYRISLPQASFIAYTNVVSVAKAAIVQASIGCYSCAARAAAASIRSSLYALLGVIGPAISIASPSSLQSRSIGQKLTLRLAFLTGQVLSESASPRVLAVIYSGLLDRACRIQKSILITQQDPS